MALPLARQTARPYPLNDPSSRYYYLARNGIYALAKRWNLNGAEILFPAYFHGVEVATLLAAGAKLRFYSVRRDMSVDTGDVKSRISSKTKVVYMIHYLGFPGPVEEIAALCRDRGLLLIEDCALALFSCLGERPLGSFGDAAVFCLYKTLPTPNGGVLWLRNPGSNNWPSARKPSSASTIAYTATAAWRHLGFSGGSPIHKLLYRARVSARSISGQLGIAPVGRAEFDHATVDLAMSRLCHWIVARQDHTAVIERRRRNFSRLFERLQEISEPVSARLPNGVCPLFYPLRTQNKDAVLRSLLACGINAGNFWSQVPEIIPKGEFPEAESLRRTTIELPCHQDLSLQDIDWMADQVCQLRKDL
jgi:dTDP-4-amino-4,6-dideoxygalactose transaminase